VRPGRAFAAAAAVVRPKDRRVAGGGGGEGGAGSVEMKPGGDAIAALVEPSPVLR